MLVGVGPEGILTCLGRTAAGILRASTTEGLEAEALDLLGAGDVDDLEAALAEALRAVVAAGRPAEDEKNRVA